MLNLKVFLEIVSNVLNGSLTLKNTTSSILPSPNAFNLSHWKSEVWNSQDLQINKEIQASLPCCKWNQNARNLTITGRKFERLIVAAIVFFLIEFALVLRATFLKPAVFTDEDKIVSSHSPQHAGSKKYCSEVMKLLL